MVTADKHGGTRPKGRGWHVIVRECDWRVECVILYSLPRPRTIGTDPLGLASVI